MNELRLFEFLKLHHVDEFPKECVEWLILTVRTNGLAGLKENRYKAIGCIFTILAWAFGRLRDQPDDGVIIGEADTEVMTRELLAILATCPDCDCSAPAGIGNGFILRQLVHLAMSYLLTLLKDSERVQDLLEEVMKWIDEQLNG